MTTTTSDGSTASYYELPQGATQLQDLISHRNMNAQDGEIFRAIYRKGLASHSDALRDARKVLFYAQAEVKRLEALEKTRPLTSNKPQWGKVEYWEGILGCRVDTVELSPPNNSVSVCFRPLGPETGREIEQRLAGFNVELLFLAPLAADRLALKARLPDAPSSRT